MDTETTTAIHRNDPMPTASPGTPLLDVRDLRVRFPSEDGVVNAVRGVNFSLEPGEVLGLVGESGSGKSVTSMSIMGLLEDTAQVDGSIKLHGTELLGRGDEWMSQVRGLRMSMVFQDPLSALTPVYSIGDQLVEALQIHRKMSGSDARKRALELLDLVGIPKPEVRIRAFPHEFSGGMRQRVVIAMAIANNPDLIIADEPTTALDVTIQAQILDLLRTAQRETDAGVVMITHDLGVVAGLADRVAVMYAGRIVEHGSAQDVFYRSRMPYTVGLLGSLPRPDQPATEPLTPVEGNPPSPLALPSGCPFGPRCPIKVDECEQVEPDLLPTAHDDHSAACHRIDLLADGTNPFADETHTARELIAAKDEIDRSTRKPVLEVHDLVKTFPLTKGAILKKRVGTVHAVDGISFDIREGETLGLVGESGCGKTTTLLQILGLEAPEDGKIVVLGKDSSEVGRSERKELRREIQVVFQDPMAALDPRMPIFDIIAEPLLYNDYPKDQIEGRVRELLELVGLEPAHGNRYPRHFSGGQRQRIGIARALALEPRLLVLDEPVSALDVSIQAGVLNLLDELRERLDLAYLFVAHDLSVIRHVASRVAVMYLGRLVEIGHVDEVFDEPKHPYTQALLSAIPVPDPDKERSRNRIILEGDLPSPADPPSGCHFHGRCQLYEILPEEDRRRCETEDPRVSGLAEERQVACFYPRSVDVF